MIPQTMKLVGGETLSELTHKRALLSYALSSVATPEDRTPIYDQIDIVNAAIREVDKQ
jgi:hypothetical protein